MNVPYHAARQSGAAIRSAYSKLVRSGRLVPVRPEELLDATVVAFSSEADLPEQVASLRSFLRHVGAPKRYIVVSDGTHQPRSARILKQQSPAVEIVDWRAFSPHVPAAVERYAMAGPMGKKLAVMMGASSKGSVFYVDADVLFFPNAAELRPFLEQASGPWFMRDCLDWHQWLGDAHSDFVSPDAEPVNGGVLVVTADLEWDFADALLTGPGQGHPWYAEQTAVHIAMHRAGARSFPTDRYVVTVSDQWRWRDDFVDSGLALRHYVGPVRHKMWNAVASAATRPRHLHDSDSGWNSSPTALTQTGAGE